jgi:Myb-like DNA-binding domain
MPVPPLHDFLPVTARRVMEDVAAWWVRVLLQDSNVNRIHEVMETILPGIVPLSSQSVLAAQLKVLSLWQEVLFNTHLQGDFSLLQDKFLLLAKDFGKSPASDHCMQLLKVHDVLGAFYDSLASGGSTTRHLRFALQALYLENELPAELDVLLQEGDDISALQAHIEALVASNSSSQSSEFSYDALRDQMQAVLLEWIQSGFETPLLVKLGYHMSAVSTMPAVPAPTVHCAGRPEIPQMDPTPRQNLPPTKARLARDTDVRDVPVTDNPATLIRQPPLAMTLRLVPAPRKTISPFQLPGRLLTGIANGIPDSEAMAEASDTDSEADNKETGVASENAKPPHNVGGPIPSSSTRGRRRSKYQKDYVASPPLLKQPDVQRGKALSKTDSNIPFDDDDDDAISEVRRRLKIRSLNSLSPLPSLPKLKSKKRTRQISGFEEQHWSADSHREAALHHRSKHLKSREGPRVGKIVDHVRITTRALTQETKRRPFTEKENNAVKEGVSRYGSDWAAIKTHFPQTLHGRTCLHIKDRARTLVKKGKLDPALLQEG